jgi:3-keto-L-gulonate-6-phosphate decarboxylase
MTTDRPDLDPASALPAASSQPRVQVALDVTSIEAATRLAHAALDAGADQLEIGKPLIEFLGLQGAASIMAASRASASSST